MQKYWGKGKWFSSRKKCPDSSSSGEMVNQLRLRSHRCRAWCTHFAEKAQIHKLLKCAWFSVKYIKYVIFITIYTTLFCFSLILSCKKQYLDAVSSRPVPAPHHCLEVFTENLEIKFLQKIFRATNLVKAISVTEFFWPLNIDSMSGYLRLWLRRIKGGELRELYLVKTV